MVAQFTDEVGLNRRFSTSITLHHNISEMVVQKILLADKKKRKSQTKAFLQPT